MKITCIFGKHKYFLLYLREMELGSKFVFQCVNCNKLYEFQTIISKYMTLKHLNWLESMDEGE